MIASISIILLAVFFGYVVYYNKPERATLDSEGNCSSKFTRRLVIIGDEKFTTRFEDIKKNDVLIFRNRYTGKYKKSKVISYYNHGSLPPIFEGSITLIEYNIVAKKIK